MIKIAFQEWKFVGLMGVILILLTFLPIIIGQIATPSDSVFLGRQTLNSPDLSVYYSSIEQVKSGHYLFKNFFTSEPHSYFIFDPFWLIIGLFAKIFSLSSFLAYQISRFLLIPILLVAAYYLIAFFFQEKIKRKICFIFLLFSSGMGWLYGFSLKNFPEIPTDLWVPEAFFFLSCYNSPHFIVSLTLIILIFLLSLLSFERYRPVYSLAAGFCVLFLSLFHPYHLPTIFGVLLVFIIICFLKEKKINFNYLKYYFILLLFALPAVFYHFWLLQNFWVRQQHFFQNICLTPSLLMVLLGYGFLSIFALIGAYILIIKKVKSQKDIFLLSWLGIQFFLIYFPFAFQRRLLEGLQIPLVILAVFGLFFLKDYLKEKPIFRKYFFSKDNLLRKIFFLWLFLICFFGSNLTILLNDLSLYLKDNSRIYLKKEEQKAMLWLKNNTPEESAILSSLENGNLIAAISLRQVYLGHLHQTAQSSKKKEGIERFFKKSNDAEKIFFLKENGIDYLYFAEEEKNQALFSPGEKEYLKKVYGNNEATIYQYRDNQ